MQCCDVETKVLRLECTRVCFAKCQCFALGLEILLNIAGFNESLRVPRQYLNQYFLCCIWHQLFKNFISNAISLITDCIFALCTLFVQSVLDNQAVQKYRSWSPYLKKGQQHFLNVVHSWCCVYYVQTRKNVRIRPPVGNCSDDNPFSGDQYHYRLISCQKVCILLQIQLLLCRL